MALQHIDNKLSKIQWEVVGVMLECEELFFLASAPGNAVGFFFSSDASIKGGGVMDDNQTLIRMIEFVARYLVDSPEQVEVKEVPGGQTTVLELVVARDDIGKVIGKKGNTARALRTILSAVAAKYHKKAILEIIE